MPLVDLTALHVPDIALSAGWLFFIFSTLLVVDRKRISQVDQYEREFGQEIDIYLPESVLKVSENENLSPRERLHAVDNYLSSSVGSQDRGDMYHEENSLLNGLYEGAAAVARTGAPLKRIRNFGLGGTGSSFATANPPERSIRIRPDHQKVSIEYVEEAMTHEYTHCIVGIESPFGSYRAKLIKSVIKAKKAGENLDKVQQKLDDSRVIHEGVAYAVQEKLSGRRFSKAYVDNISSNYGPKVLDYFEKSKEIIDAVGVKGLVESVRNLVPEGGGVIIPKSKVFLRKHVRDQQRLKYLTKVVSRRYKSFDQIYENAMSGVSGYRGMMGSLDKATAKTSESRKGRVKET